MSMCMCLCFRVPFPRACLSMCTCLHVRVPCLLTARVYESPIPHALPISNYVGCPYNWHTALQVRCVLSRLFTQADSSSFANDIDMQHHRATGSEALCKTGSFFTSSFASFRPNFSASVCGTLALAARMFFLTGGSFPLPVPAAALSLCFFEQDPMALSKAFFSHFELHKHSQCQIESRLSILFCLIGQEDLHTLACRVLGNAEVGKDLVVLETE